MVDVGKPLRNVFFQSGRDVEVKIRRLRLLGLNDVSLWLSAAQ